VNPEGEKGKAAVEKGKAAVEKGKAAYC